MTINPAFAQTLALLVHELLTNALNYGALKPQCGQVSFIAELIKFDGKDGVRFNWSETGGPPPARPDETGFCQRMLEMAVRQRGGTVSYDWLPAGLVCEFEIFDLGA